MTYKDLEDYLKDAVGYTIDDKWTVFRDATLFDEDTGDEVKYDSIEKLVNDNPQIKKWLAEHDELMITNLRIYEDSREKDK